MEEMKTIGKESPHDNTDGVNPWLMVSAVPLSGSDFQRILFFQSCGAIHDHIIEILNLLRKNAFDCPADIFPWLNEGVTIVKSGVCILPTSIYAINFAIYFVR